MAKGGEYEREELLHMFWRQVQIRSSKQCWYWIGPPHDDKGYGRFNIPGQRYLLAHRFAKLSISCRHNTICVLHSCDNPSCCNPNHLFTGTKADNNKDRADKNRSFRPRGENGSAAKLTWDRVRRFRALYSSGIFTLKELAPVFGVHWTNLQMIAAGKTWKEDSRG